MSLAASQLGDALDHIGVIVVALLAGAALLAPSTRGRAYAALGALVLTPILLVADIWDDPSLVSLRDHPPVAAGAVAAALVAVSALAWVLYRWPALLPLLAITALPFRIPISAGGETANLLVPLYLVIGAGVLATAIPRLRDEDDDAPFKPGWLEWLLCASVALYAVQTLYSDDFTKGLQNVVFFYVPFALLFGLLREVHWTQKLALQCLCKHNSLVDQVTSLHGSDGPQRTLRPGLLPDISISGIWSNESIFKGISRGRNVDTVFSQNRL